MSGPRFVMICVAWALGTAIYVLAAINDGLYDGMLSVIFLPMCGANVSGLFIGVGLLVGLATRPTPLGRLWRSSRVWAMIAAFGSATLLSFGSAAGLTVEHTDQETGRRFNTLHPAAVLGGYFLLLFAVSHWPLGGSFTYTLVQRFGEIDPTLPEAKTYDPTANSAQKLPGRQG